MRQLIAEKASLKDKSDRWRNDNSELKVLVCTLACLVTYSILDMAGHCKLTLHSSVLSCTVAMCTVICSYTLMTQNV